MENQVLDREKMTPNAYRLYNYLCKYHVGKENAVIQDNLVSLVDLDRRIIRSLINEINNYQGNVKVVCSGNVGVWIANSEEEILETTSIYKKKALSMMKSYSSMTKKLSKHNQLKLTFTNHEKPIVEAFSSYTDEDIKSIKSQLEVR